MASVLSKHRLYMQCSTLWSSLASQLSLNRYVNRRPPQISHLEQNLELGFAEDATPKMPWRYSQIETSPKQTRKQSKPKESSKTTKVSKANQSPKPDGPELAALLALSGCQSQESTGKLRCLSQRKTVKESTNQSNKFAGSPIETYNPMIHWCLSLKPSESLDMEVSHLVSCGLLETKPCLNFRRVKSHEPVKEPTIEWPSHPPEYPVKSVWTHRGVICPVNPASTI